MYKVTKEIPFCYGHRLLNYHGKCQHLHGHNARAIITLKAEQLDHLGMVYDFSEFGKKIKEWIDNEIDHTLLLHHEDPIVDTLMKHNEKIYIMDSNPTAENIARLIFEYTLSLGYPITEVTLKETDDSFASYCPS